VSWPPPGFRYAGARGGRLECTTCGARGWTYLDPRSWMAVHGRPHHPCPWCGRPLVTKLDGTPRVHTRCPNRPKE